MKAGLRCARAKNVRNDSRMSAPRLACLLGVIALVASVVGCAGNGSEGQPSGSRTSTTNSDRSSTATKPIDQDSSASELAERIDYSELSSYRCDRLLKIVEEIAGAGERSGEPFGEIWFGGTLKGGCVVFGPDAVSIEVHLAEPDTHSFVFSLDRPNTAAGRREAAVQIGDEAYLDNKLPSVVARRGFVEVSLRPYPLNEGAEVMDVETMKAVAAAILEPWPSGPGADESLKHNPPQMPIPASADSGDWALFNPAEMNRKFVEEGAEPPYDRDFLEVNPPVWSLPFRATAPELRRYCESLEGMGFTHSRFIKLLAELGEVKSSSEISRLPCFRTDGKWFVIALPPDSGDNKSSVIVYDWSRFAHRIKLCDSQPEREGCAQS